VYYKDMMIVNDDSSIVNKLGASLTDNARVVIYGRHMFIVQATSLVTRLESSMFGHCSMFRSLRSGRATPMLTWCRGFKPFRFVIDNYRK